MSFSRLLGVSNPPLFHLFTRSALSSSSLTIKASFSSSTTTDMVKAIRVHELGGPQVNIIQKFSFSLNWVMLIELVSDIASWQVLKWEEVEIGEPKEGEVRVRNKAIGVNFIDVYFRKGVYKAPSFPFTPGSFPIFILNKQQQFIYFVVCCEFSL